MKGCLKQASRAPSPSTDQPTVKKSVAFNAEGSEQIFFADEWDRTPTEPARHLSYQDLLELKEIQRSLPRAEQPADLISGRPGSHYLSTVPIALLPLLPSLDSPVPAPSPPSSSPSPTATSSVDSQHTTWRTSNPPSRASKSNSGWRPPQFSHLPPGRPPIPRPKPRFAFLPLLETSSNASSPPPPPRSPSPDFQPSDSDQSHDPPTPSLTNASTSVDSSPLSRASSCSPEPPSFLQLPPSKYSKQVCYGSSVYSDEQPAEVVPTSDAHKPGTAHMPSSSQQRQQRPGFGSSSVPLPAPVSATRKEMPKKKTVIVVNGLEIELDNDSDDDEGKSGASKGPGSSDELSSTPPASSNIKSLPSTALSIPSSPPTPRPACTPTPPSPTSSPVPSSHAPVLFKRSMPSTHSSVSQNRNCNTVSGNHGSGRGRSSPVLVHSA